MGRRHLRRPRRRRRLVAQALIRPLHRQKVARWLGSATDRCLLAGGGWVAVVGAVGRAPGGVCAGVCGVGRRTNRVVGPTSREPGGTDAHGRPHPRQRRRPHRRATVTGRLPEGPRPREVQGAGPTRHPPGERHRRLAHRGPGARHLRAERGAGPSARELGRRPRQLRPGPSRHLRRPRAHPRHERQRRARVAQLPVVARPRWPVLRAERRHRVRRGDDPRLQRLAHRRVVRRLPRALHPARALRLRAR